MGRDPEPAGNIDRLVGAHFEDEPGIDRVDRMDRRLDEVHGAAALVLEVPHMPDTAARQREIERLRRRIELVQGDALLHGGGEHERLERRPRGALTLGGEVELGLAAASEEVSATDQGADVAGTGLERHDGS